MALWKLVNNRWAKAQLADQYSGSDVFFCCPGPSLAHINSHDMNVPGAAIFAVNTAYPKIRPDVWIGMDKAECYDTRLWHEPFIKICRGAYHDMKLNGTPVMSFPNTYFADCEHGAISDIFTCKGEDVKFVWQNNTFMVAIHVAVWMGAKRIWLVGCDFGGNKDYYDDRVLSEENRSINRTLYTTLVSQLPELRTAAEEHGVSIISCTPDSPANDYLPFVPLSNALQTVQDTIPKSVTSPLNCRDIQLCEWSANPKGDGVVTGCDSHQEWMLLWWWVNYSKYNTLPVAFADFGMTESGRKWCEERGEVVDVRDVSVSSAWFKKPFALLRSPFQRMIWVDLDCEIRGDIQIIGAFCGKLNGVDAVGLALDSPYPAEWRKTSLPGEEVFNAGVIAVEHGSPVVKVWAKKTLAEATKFRGDQDILNRVLHLLGAPVVLMPKKYNNLRLDKEHLDDALIYHWTGSEGKKQIQQQLQAISPFSVYNERSGVTSDEATVLVQYAKASTSDIVEIGTWLGGTTEILAEANPNVCVWTIDCYAPHKEYGGTHPNNPVEMYRDRFNMSSRVFPVIGQSQEIGRWWSKPIGFLFIDGLHTYSGVAGDFQVWTPWVVKDGVVAIHDAVNVKSLGKKAMNGNPLYGCPDVIRFVEELKQQADWQIIETVDSIVFLKKR